MYVYHLHEEPIGTIALLNNGKVFQCRATLLEAGNFKTLCSKQEKRSASRGTPKIPNGSLESCPAFDFQSKFLGFFCLQLGNTHLIDQYSLCLSCSLLFAFKPHLPSSQGASFHLQYNLPLRKPSFYLKEHSG